MSQSIFSDINPSSTSGNQLATLLNGFKDAVASGFSGATRPPNLQAGGYWVDTSLAASPDFLWILKVWTGSTNLTLFTMNINSNTVSVGGAEGSFDISKTSADVVGPILNLVKKRVANSGQTLQGDSLGDLVFKSTTNAGAQISAARMRVVVNESTTVTNSGSYITFEAIDTGSAALLEKMRLKDGLLGIGTTTPVYRVHAKGAEGIGTEIEVDSAVGAKLTFRKKRVSTNGKVLNSDVIAQIKANSTDQTGAEITDTFLMEVSATQDHTSAAQGTRVDFKSKDTGSTTATTKLSLIDGLVEMVLGATTKFLKLGTHATAANNLKLHRSAAGKLSVALGNDATAEGTEPTTVGQFSARVENFTNAGKPAAGNIGRIIYVTDTAKFEYDNGTAWVGLGGGALVVSTVVADSSASLPFTGTTARRLYNLAPASAAQDFTGLAKQIADGVDAGQELWLVGTDDTKYCSFKDGANLSLVGDWTAGANAVLQLVWTGSIWLETSRRGV